MVLNISRGSFRIEQHTQKIQSDSISRIQQIVALIMVYFTIVSGSHSTRSREVVLYDYCENPSIAKSVIIGAGLGVKDLYDSSLEVLKDPIGNLFVPITVLAFDIGTFAVVNAGSSSVNDVVCSTKVYKLAEARMQSRAKVISEGYREFKNANIYGKTQMAVRFFTPFGIPAAVKKVVELMRMGQLESRTLALLDGAPGVNFVPLSDAIRRVYQHSGGTGGVFITDLRKVENAIGKIFLENTRMTISASKATNLEQRLGLRKGSAQDGGVLSIIEDVHLRAPRSPLHGNNMFLGGGSGLPKGGPELVIAPLRNTGGGRIKQIDILVEKSIQSKKMQAKRLISDFAGKMTPISANHVSATGMSQVVPSALTGSIVAIRGNEEDSLSLLNIKGIQIAAAWHLLGHEKSLESTAQIGTHLMQLLREFPVQKNEILKAYEALFERAFTILIEEGKKQIPEFSSREFLGYFENEKSRQKALIGLLTKVKEDISLFPDLAAKKEHVAAVLNNLTKANQKYTEDTKDHESLLIWRKELQVLIEAWEVAFNTDPQEAKKLQKSIEVHFENSQGFLVRYMERYNQPSILNELNVINQIIDRREKERAELNWYIKELNELDDKRMQLRTNRNAELEADYAANLQRVAEKFDQVEARLEIGTEGITWKEAADFQQFVMNIHVPIYQFNVFQDTARNSLFKHSTGQFPQLLTREGLFDREKMNDIKRAIAINEMPKWAWGNWCCANTPKYDVSKYGEPKPGLENYRKWHQTITHDIKVGRLLPSFYNTKASSSIDVKFVRK